MSLDRVAERVGEMRWQKHYEGDAGTPNPPTPSRVLRLLMETASIIRHGAGGLPCIMTYDALQSVERPKKWQIWVANSVSV